MGKILTLSHLSTRYMLMSSKAKSKMSPEQIQEAWNYWYPLVYGYFFRRINSRDDVEDLTSVTLTALFTKDDVKNPKGFVWQTARNQLNKYIEKKSSSPTYITLDEVSENYLSSSIKNTPGYDEQEPDVVSPWYLEKKKRLIECIENNLKEEAQEIVKLSLIEEKNSTQIGQILEIKPATVRQKLKRSIQKLRKECKTNWQKAGIGILLIVPGIKANDLSNNIFMDKNSYIPKPKEEETWQYLFEENDSYLQGSQSGLANVFKKVGIEYPTIASQTVKPSTTKISKNLKRVIGALLISSLISGGMLINQFSRANKNITNINLESLDLNNLEIGQLPSINNREIALDGFLDYAKEVKEEIEENEEKEKIADNQTTNTPINNPVPRTPVSNPAPDLDPSADPTPDPTPDPIPDPVPTEVFETGVNPNIDFSDPFFSRSILDCSELILGQTCFVSWVAVNPDFVLGDPIPPSFNLRDCSIGRIYFTNNQLASLNGKGCVDNNSGMNFGKQNVYDINLPQSDPSQPDLDYIDPGFPVTNITYIYELSEPSAQTTYPFADFYHPADSTFGVQKMRIYRVIYGGDKYVYEGSKLYTKFMYHDNANCDPENMTHLQDPKCVANETETNTIINSYIQSNLEFQNIKNVFVGSLAVDSVDQTNLFPYLISENR
jgi:RNA polymerase sigma factor (sigma-70 family)